MKVSKSQIRQIVKEQVSKILNEGTTSRVAVNEYGGGEDSALRNAVQLLIRVPKGEDRHQAALLLGNLLTGVGSSITIKQVLDYAVQGEQPGGITIDVNDFINKV